MELDGRARGVNSLSVRTRGRRTASGEALQVATITRIQWFISDNDAYLKFTVNFTFSTLAQSGKMVLSFEEGGLTYNASDDFANDAGNNIDLFYGTPIIAGGGNSGAFTQLDVVGWGGIKLDGATLPPPASFFPGDGVMDADPDETIVF